MEIALIAISVLTLALVAYLLVRPGVRGMSPEDAARIEGALANIRQELGGSLSQGQMGLTELITKANGDIRQELSDRLSKGLSDVGQKVQAKLDENIKEGFSHFEKVQEHLQRAEAHLVGVTAVGSSINELNNLLKLPHLRGGFGEAALEIIIADFLPASFYELQAQMPGTTERVDALIKLPGANLPIDSKFPREQVLPLFESSDADKLALARKTLSRVVRDMAKDIASKYIRPDLGTTDMALMFLPSETLYFEVVRDAELWGALQKAKVYPVSPNTLAITLKGLTLSYEYYTMAKGVEKTVEDIRKARKHFAHFTDKFEAVGKQLDKAREAYGTASTHLGTYQSSVVRLTGGAADDDESAPLTLPNIGTPAD